MNQDDAGANVDHGSAEAQLEQLREAVLDDWVIVIDRVTRTQREMENTVSWRVTKPLRLIRLFQRKAADVGTLAAARIAADSLRNRWGSRR